LCQNIQQFFGWKWRRGFWSHRGHCRLLDLA
jgi:hypothetical protein